MKNLFLAILFLAFAFPAFSQSATPRFSTATNGDNTFRNQKITLRTITDAALKDTFVLIPNSFRPHVLLNVTDTVVLAVNKTTSYLADELTVVIKNTSGANHQVIFGGKGANAATNWQLGSGGATLSLTTAKSSTISFIFDGTNWVEKSRTIQ